MMAKSGEIPTKEDWGVIPADDLDLRAAYEDFFGKSNDEMRPMFAKCVIEMADALRWMPVIPFRYYVKGFADFVMSGEFHELDASDVANTFLNLVTEKLAQQPTVIAPVIDHLLPAVEHVSKNPEDFDADIDIYGDFSERGRAIMDLWASIKERS